jgi:hypothetical protein
VCSHTAEGDGFILQQDGASAPFGATVRTALDEEFPGRRIGRGEPINWPPRTPELTPMDFFVWVYIIDIVHVERVESLPHSSRRITAAVAVVLVDALCRVWGEAVSCAHIELQ